MEKPIVNFETKRFYVRNVREEDKKPYMALRSENSEFSIAYEKLPGFIDHEWEEELNSQKDIYLSVFLKNNGVFVGSASIQDYKEDTIELGFDVCKEYWNQGFATEIINRLVLEKYEMFGDSKVIIRTILICSTAKKQHGTIPGHALGVVTLITL